jgi:hypothetical protein
MDQLLKADGDMVIWWASPVECSSAIARLQRDLSLTPQDVISARAVLHALQLYWTEVHPVESVRRHAERLVQIHVLRAADALQLGAALAWTRAQPRGSDLVSLDKRLRAAAALEGFTVLP